jgi:hypothetical protein
LAASGWAEFTACIYLMAMDGLGMTTDLRNTFTADDDPMVALMPIMIETMSTRKDKGYNPWPAAWVYTGDFIARGGEASVDKEITMQHYTCTRSAEIAARLRSEGKHGYDPLTSNGWLEYLSEETMLTMDGLMDAAPAVLPADDWDRTARDMEAKERHLMEARERLKNAARPQAPTLDSGNPKKRRKTRKDRREDITKAKSAILPSSQLTKEKSAILPSSQFDHESPPMRLSMEDEQTEFDQETNKLKQQHDAVLAEKMDLESKLKSVQAELDAMEGR